MFDAATRLLLSRILPMVGHFTPGIFAQSSGLVSHRLEGLDLASQMGSA
jgi:hypothetical protein